MIEWHKTTISGNCEYFYGVDTGTTDMTAVVEGYKDDQGAYYVTKMEHYDNVE